MATERWTLQLDKFIRFTLFDFGNVQLVVRWCAQGSWAHALLPPNFLLFSSKEKVNRCHFLQLSIFWDTRKWTNHSDVGHWLLCEIGAQKKFPCCHSANIQLFFSRSKNRNQSKFKASTSERISNRSARLVWNQLNTWMNMKVRDTRESPRWDLWLTKWEINSLTTNFEINGASHFRLFGIVQTNSALGWRSLPCETVECRNVALSKIITLAASNLAVKLSVTEKRGVRWPPDMTGHHLVPRFPLWDIDQWVNEFTYLHIGRPLCCVSSLSGKKSTKVGHRFGINIIHFVMMRRLYDQSEWMARWISENSDDCPGCWRRFHFLKMKPIEFWKKINSRWLSR